MKRKLKYVKLRNIMGLGVDDGEISFEFGKKNIVTGSNGVGKTRLLNAIKLLFSDRLRTDWVRTNNEGEGEIIAIFDDDTKIELKAKENRMERKFYDNESIPINSKQFLSTTISDIAIDPAKFLDEKGWEYRIKSVISALNIDTKEEEWGSIFEGDIPQGFNYNDDIISQIEYARKYFEEKRRSVGQVRKEYENTVVSLKKSLPEKLDTESIENELESVGKEIESKLQEQKDKENEIEKDYYESISEIDNKIHQLELEIQQLITQKEQIRANIENSKRELDAQFSQEIANLRDKENELSRKMEDVASARNTEELIKQNESNYDKYDKAYKKYDDVLKRLKGWQKELFSKCPIEGLSIKDKDIEINGYPWNVVNTAEKVRVFLQVAKLTLKDCPLILFDNYEMIGEKIRKELVDKLIEEDIQVIFAQLDPKEGVDLTVKVEA